MWVFIDVNHCIVCSLNAFNTCCVYLQNLSLPRNVPIFFWLTFKKAFGNRWVSICSGLNLYAAKRGQSRAKPNILEGPGSLKKNAYCRSYFVDSQQPAAMKLVNQLKEIAESNMCIMDPTMVNVCASAIGIKDKRNICMLFIVTCGAPGWGYGFANSIHFDLKDLIRRVLCDRYLKKVDASMCYALFPEHWQEKRLYIQKWIDRFGTLSVPTTCAYEFIGDFHTDPHCVMCFFLFPAIACAIELQSSTALQFYGAVLQHMTSVTVAVNHDVVSYAHGDGAVFAWGAGSSADADVESTDGDAGVGDTGGVTVAGGIGAAGVGGPGGTAVGAGGGAPADQSRVLDLDMFEIDLEGIANTYCKDTAIEGGGGVLGKMMFSYGLDESNGYSDDDSDYESSDSGMDG